MSGDPDPDATSACAGPRATASRRPCRCSWRCSPRRCGSACTPAGALSRARARHRRRALRRAGRTARRATWRSSRSTTSRSTSSTQRWPFRRSLHARVIDRLDAARARGRSPTTSSSPSRRASTEDNALIEAVDRAPRIVLATTEVDAQGRSRVLGGEELLAEIGARSGNAILNQDEGGVQRTRPVLLRRPRELRGGRDGAGDGPAGRPGRVRRRRRVDRLPRAAGHRPDVLVLARAARQVPGRRLPRPGRGGRRLGAAAAGRPSRPDEQRRR